MTGITTSSAGSPAAPVRLTSPTIIVITAAVSSVILGVGAGGLGTTLNDLSTRTGSPTETLGILFTMIFMASLFSQLFAGTINDRFGARPIVLMGAFTYGAGLILCSFSRSLFVLCLTGLILGAGQGMLGIGRILLVTENFPTQRVRYTSLTSVFYSVGAVIGPFIGGLSLRLVGSALPLLWVAGIGALLIFFEIMLVSGLDSPTPARSTLVEIPESIASERSRRSDSLKMYHSATLWLSGATLLIYGGLETGMSGWTSLYVQRSTALPAENAALFVSAFFLTLMVGRLINVVIGTRYKPRSILAVACTGALIGTGLMIVGRGSLPLTFASVLLLGLSYGPIFPTTFALITGTFRHAPGKAGGLVAAMGSLGASLLVPVQGFMLERGGTIANPIYLMVALLAMCGLFVLTLRLLTQSSGVPQTA